MRSMNMRPFVAHITLLAVMLLVGCTLRIDPEAEADPMHTESGYAAVNGLEIYIEQADFFGYSMGGGIALELAIRYPEVVSKLIVASAGYNRDGTYPELWESIEQLTPEAFAGSGMQLDYANKAPNPENWPTLIAKVQQLNQDFEGWASEDVQAIDVPTLLIIGDSDNIRPEHAAEMFRLLGGGVVGDLTGLPASQLAVLLGATHISVMERTEWLVSMISEFLKAPMPQTS